METLFVAASAFGGGLASGELGWLHGGEPFVGRKFAASVVRAFVAGGAFAGAYTMMGAATIEDMVIAFAAGAGVDVIGHRLSKK